MALTRKYANIKVSINHDGLTLYPLSQDADRKIEQNCFHLLDQDVKNTRVLRYVKREHDDHELYHKDNLCSDYDHFHIKFEKPIDANGLSDIVTELKKFELISESEANDLLNHFNNSCRDALKQLRESLSGTKEIQSDTRAIIQFVFNCNSINILLSVHKALCDTRFEYLRDRTKMQSETIWQGTNNTDKLIQTTENWSMIEKAISLQLIQIIRRDVSHFSEAVANETAFQLNNAFPSFSIKRKSKPSSPSTSSFFRAVCKKDEEMIEAKYQKLRKRYL